MVSQLLLPLVICVQQPSVTLRCPATALSKVLPQIASQAKVELSAGDMADRPLLLAVKDMPVETLLERIATVFDAEWKKQGNGRVLTRTRERVRAAADKESADRAEWLTQKLQKLVQENQGKHEWAGSDFEKRIAEETKLRQDILKSMGNDIPENAVIEFGDSRSPAPADILLWEALEHLKPTALAGVPSGSRIVYASSPNRMQTALPYSSKRIADFILAHNRMVDYRNSKQGVVPGQPTFRTPNSNTTKIDRIGKLYIFVTRHGEDMQVSCTVAGTDGAILGTAQQFLGRPPAPSPTEMASDPREIKLSEDAHAVVKALQTEYGHEHMYAMRLRMGEGLTASLGGDPKPRNLTAPVKAALANPAELDPLAGFASEIFLGLQKHLEKDMVAALPDLCFGPLASVILSGRVSVSELMKKAPVMGIQIADEEGTVVVRPLNQARADRSSVNRKELSRFLSGFAKSGFARLNDAARYSLYMPGVDSENLDWKVISLLAPTSLQMLGNPNQDQLRLYGMLAEGQKQEAMDQVKVPFSNLTPNQKTLFSQVVYRPGGPQILGEGTWISMSVGDEPARRPVSNILTTEPTERFPDGVPQNAALTITRERGEGAFALDKSGAGTLYSAGDIGLRLGSGTNLPEEMYVARGFTGFIPATVIDVDIAVVFGDQNRKSEGLRDGILQPGSAVPLDQLPIGLQAVINRAKEQAANMRFMQFGTGGGNPPPPSVWSAGPCPKI